ncbi:hypothetical protein [Streptomyces sp. NPDC005538]|uniref:hypothetical protein n=1 Tax=unclassified Streptomyces TaxID=2593676 RepID=UPI0033AB5DF9
MTFAGTEARAREKVMSGFREGGEDDVAQGCGEGGRAVVQRRGFLLFAECGGAFGQGVEGRVLEGVDDGVDVGEDVSVPVGGGPVDQVAEAAAAAAGRLVDQPVRSQAASRADRARITRYSVGQVPLRTR